MSGYTFRLADLFFPLAPESVKVTEGAKTYTLSVLDLGDVVIPRGTNPIQIQLAGIFPGLARAQASFIFQWRDPATLVAAIDALLVAGVNGGTAPFRVSETSIDYTVFVSAFTWTTAGAFGDIAFELTLVEYRPLVVVASTTYTSAPSGTTTTARPPPPTPYVVQSGDSLVSIAAKLYGDSNRYYDIWQANLSLIGSDYGNISAGTSLTIPGGIAATPRGPGPH